MKAGRRSSDPDNAAFNAPPVSCDEDWSSSGLASFFCRHTRRYHLKYHLNQTSTWWRSKGHYPNPSKLCAKAKHLKRIGWCDPEISVVENGLPEQKHLYQYPNIRLRFHRVQRWKNSMCSWKQEAVRRNVFRSYMLKTASSLFAFKRYVYKATKTRFGFTWEV